MGKSTLGKIATVGALGATGFGLAGMGPMAGAFGAGLGPLGTTVPVGGSMAGSGVMGNIGALGKNLGIAGPSIFKGGSTGILSATGPLGLGSVGPMDGLKAYSMFGGGQQQQQLPAAPGGAPMPPRPYSPSSLAQIQSTEQNFPYRPPNARIGYPYG